MGKIRKPQVFMTYDNVDITESVTPFLIGFTYTDKLESDSPVIDFELEDTNKLWQNEWFPKTGAEVSVKLRYANEPEFLYMHKFQIDSIEFFFSARGDTLRLGAQQTPFSKNLREKRSKEYEKITLQKIIEDIAKRQQLRILGNIPQLTFERITQNEESDLEFLTRLANDFGLIFKIESTQLIFYDRKVLNADNPQFNLGRGDITRIEATKKLTGMYGSARLVYEGTNTEGAFSAVTFADPPNNSQDVLIVNEKVESIEQAQMLVAERLRRANADEYSGTIELEGEYRYIAGINFTLFDFGAFNGVWQIQQVEHHFTPTNGWKSALKVFRLRD